jgi:hypothetical protein
MAMMQASAGAGRPRDPQLDERVHAAARRVYSQVGWKRGDQKYRAQLREEQAARAADKDRHDAQIADLRNRLTNYQRAEAERIASKELVQGSDLWHDGTSLDALLDEEGNIDAERVAEVCEVIRLLKPHWGLSVAAPANLVTSDGKVDFDPPPTEFKDAFRLVGDHFRPRALSPWRGHRH